MALPWAAADVSTTRRATIPVNEWLRMLAPIQLVQNKASGFASFASAGPAICRNQVSR